MRIKFDKVDRIIRLYDGTRYLALFGSENYDAIYNRIYATTMQQDLYDWLQTCDFFCVTTV